MKQAHGIRILLMAGALALLMGAPAAAAHPGFVDCSRLVEMGGGDDAVRVEVNLSGGLLRALAKVDPDLYELVQDLYSVNAVVLAPGRGGAEQARLTIRSMGEELTRRGWERIARVREEDADVQVLVRTKDEKIEGLVVLVVEINDPDDDDEDGGEIVCANIAGMIDLEKVRQIGEGFDIPGLGDLTDDDLSGEDDDED